MLQTTNGTDLPVSEVCALRIAKIDNQPDRICLRVRQGKDRYTLLPPTLLEALRHYLVSLPSQGMFFPSRYGSGPISMTGT
jgi:integrase